MRGLAPATSGNYSMRLSDGRIAITVSGRHKGRMNDDDIMAVDKNGTPLESKKPSAETLLHVSLYKIYPDVHAILHTHSIPGVAITRFFRDDDTISLEGYELLKAFPGITTHDTRIDIPVFDNTQDMEILSREVESRLRQNPQTPAYIIRDHGIYTWGQDMAEAERVTEALEHLLACELETVKLRATKKAGASA